MGCRFEFRTQKLPYETILGNFFDFVDFGLQVRVLIKKIWDLHKFGLQIWIQNTKITLWKNFGQFFDFIDFGHQVRVCKKRSHSILAVIQKIWDLHKFGLQIWIQNAKLPYERISGNFFDFIDFVIRSWYAKKDHFSILAVIQNIWDLHKFGLQIWIQNAKITLWKNFGQFFRFHWFWSSGPGMQKKVISQY